MLQDLDRIAFSTFLCRHKKKTLGIKICVYLQSKL